MSRTLLMITPSAYAEIKAKGTDWMFQDREEGGYFHRVVTLHHNTKKRRVIRISGHGIIIETGGRSKITRLINAIVAGLYICSRYDAVIVRSTDPFKSGLIGWIVSWLSRNPFCISIHSDYQQDFEIWGRKAPRLWKWVPGKLMRFLLLRADMVMAISESLREYAVKNGAKRKSVRVIPHGVDARVFLQATTDADLRKRFGGRVAVAVVTRFAPDQYLTDLVELSDRMHSDNVVFVVSGDDSRCGTLANLDNVILLGHLDRTDVAGMLASCDIGLCFTAGLRTVEMALAGLPIVAYDLDWNREVVGNGVCGVLAEEHDVARLADLIRWLVSNPVSAKKLGDNGRKFASRHYSVEQTRQIKIECYEELIGMTGRPRA